MSDDNLNLSEFDYIMSAVADYTMDRNLDKEMFWNIINHVNDGYEFLTAIEAQGHLMEIVENHNIMRKYHNEKFK
tara:strand:+ start:118 stop:342 length:225 start_codon:yes stop_codon:yes gene_type:complete